MYDRYKSKRKNTGIYKFLGILAIIGAIIFLGIRYHRYLTFWKFSQNKLEKRVETVRQIKEIDKKREALADLSETYERYKEEHPVDPDAFYVSGEIHYMLGELHLPGNFSELYINDRVHDVSKDAKLEFLKAIRDIKKGCALDNSVPDDNRSFMLAKAGFYTDYSSPAEILRMIEKTGESIKLKENVENIRFYSIANIMNKREDYGLKYLAAYGTVKDNIQGLLFYATAERAAKKYTGAIVSYKNVLARTSDDKLRKLVHINLGKIYFNQSLYRESIDQFSRALKIDERDSMPKIWIGKNYSAMGEKDKAKAIWSEVLTRDGANTEVKKLMGIM
jgi:tetratricopeptide (TPR) repeat protein